MNVAKEMAKQTTLTVICLFRVFRVPGLAVVMTFCTAEQKNMKCRNKMA